MKKDIFLIFFLAIISTLTSCSKTDVDVELEENRIEEESLTDDEVEKLSDDQEFQQDYIEAYDEAVDENLDNEKMDLINELEAAKADKRTGKGVIGSCNMITESSTCVEYYGSFWTAEQIKLGCENGIYSKQACPMDTIGGCNVGGGTVSDMIPWLYLRGNGGMTAESVKHAKSACDATFMSNWITR